MKSIMNNRNYPLMQGGSDVVPPLTYIPKITIDKITPHNDRCAPDVDFINGSCLNLTQLSAMATEYNAHSSDGFPINVKFETLYPTEYKIYLLFEFQQRFGNDQSKWIENKVFKEIKADVMDEILNYTFLPDGPTGTFEWLSNFDHVKKFKQYERKYTDFKWLGAVPVDFEEYSQEFDGFNLTELKALNKTRFAFIINMDRHNQSGSHWVSLMCDLDLGHLYYIDSVGSPPPQLVRKFMQKIDAYFKKNGIKTPDIRHNNVPNQKGNTECGVYSIRAILKWLKHGKENGWFDKFKEKIVTDTEIVKCRGKYFDNAATVEYSNAQ